MKSKLLAPLRIRGIELRNRILISPMCQYSADAAGHESDWHLAHYGRLAIGGAGLVMLEATAVLPNGRLGYGDLGIWSDEHVPGLARIAALIEAEGAVPAIQLGHSGRKASTQRPWHGNGPLGSGDLALRGEAPWRPVSVTEEPAGPGHQIPRMLSPEDIGEVVAAWQAAALRARKAGFRALEIHGAHGYLIHSFLSPLSNRRTDAYGGDLAGRMRFCLEVVEAVRSVWPRDLPLFFRVSATDAASDGWSLDSSIALAMALKARGVDFIDCSSGGIGNDYSVVPRVPGFQVPYAEKIRQAAGVPTIAVGLITEAVQAEEILAREQADLIAIGREALLNPNWPLHARLQLEPEDAFAHWPPQSGWWLARRKPSRKTDKSP